MAESDHKLCARLAVWQGWKSRRICRLSASGRLCEPQTCPIEWVDYCQHARHVAPPTYDTDPVEALKLLGWLVEKGWRAVIHVSKSHSYVDLVCEMREIEDVTVKGLPSIAFPKAIALVAVEVLESEVSDA